MKLSLDIPRIYRVKKGQTLSSVANAFQVPPFLLARENALEEEISEGQVLLIGPVRGNAYVVRGGESKTLLCGSPARFEELNGTSCFYIGQRVYLE